MSSPGGVDLSLAELEALTPAHLKTLADALAGGALSAPYAVTAVARCVPVEHADTVCALLASLAASGMQSSHVALMARAIAAERLRAERIADRIALVWTGPDLLGAETRDTSVVVRELFERATESVLVTGYVVHGGKAVFETLAKRMDAIPSLDVRIFLNISRPEGDLRDPVHLEAEFARQFAKQHWPAARAPRLYYDPRGLALEKKDRAVLHAKCIVADTAAAFVSSANLTDAAQYRNVEAGILVEDSQIAKRLRRQFDVLVEHNRLKAIPWPT